MTVQYAELHCLSNYSFLRGASHPEELVRQAHALGYQALALTDECTYAGLVKAHMAAKECGIHFIIGAEFLISLDAETQVKVVLLATNRETYGQLAALVSKLRRRADKGEYTATLDDFRWGLQGCLALWVPEHTGITSLLKVGRELQDVFAELWIALALFRDGHDLDKMANALTLSIRLGLAITACSNAHTHTPERQPLQDLVTAIRHRTTIAEAGPLTYGNAERTLRSISELQTLYPPEMLAESVKIAERCQFSMDELRYEYPQDLVPPHLTPQAYLRQLTFAGAQERWPKAYQRLLNNSSNVN